MRKCNNCKIGTLDEVDWCSNCSGEVLWLPEDQRELKAG